jgi:transposase
MLPPLSLPLEEKLTLEAGFSSHKKAYFRKKCHIILLHSEGWSPKALAKLYKVRTESIYDWLHAYQKDGFLSFYIKKGRGLTGAMSQLSAEQVAVVRQSIQENPQSLRTVAPILSAQFGFLLTKSMLKQYLKKKLNYTFHRLRKWLKPKQNQAEYRKLAAELAVLKQLDSENQIKLYFGDESGFSLDPCIPYGWQPCGQYNAIVPQNSQRRNVFGLLRRNNEFEGYDVTGTMNSEAIIAFLDDFATRITQKTVVVLDNATIHHAKIFEQQRIAWEKQNLFIWFLPTYSPHLNIIEILWRKIKYEWLKPHHFANWTTLTQALDHIFNNIGTEFNIQFA